jgi:hypothetical protein
MLWENHFYRTSKGSPIDIVMILVNLSVAPFDRAGCKSMLVVTSSVGHIPYTSKDLQIPLFSPEGKYYVVDFT